MLEQSDTGKKEGDQLNKAYNDYMAVRYSAMKILWSGEIRINRWCTASGRDGIWII